MKTIYSVLVAAALTLGLVSTAIPATAQPPRIFVHGATRILPPPPFTSYRLGADWGDPLDFYGSPVGRYYDPVGKIPDMRYYGPPAVDLVLARTLDRNNESMMSHTLTCQAHYPTYNMVTNTYYGRNGLPQVCYR